MKLQSSVLQGMSRIIPLFALVTLIPTLPAYGTTWQVATNGVDAPSCGTAVAPCQTIPYTITNIAASGDSIVIQPGTYVGRITVSKDLTLQGSAPWNQSPTILDGGQQGTVVTIPSGVTATLSQLIIQNGFVVQARPIDDNAGGINNQGTLTLSDSVVQNNTAIAQNGNPWLTGGGILNRSTLTITSSAITGNSGQGGCETGGAIVNGGSLNMQGSVISGSSASTTGCSGASAIPPGEITNVGGATISTTYLPGGSIVDVGGLALIQSTIGGTGGVSVYGSLSMLNSTVAGYIGLIAGTHNGSASIGNSTIGRISFAGPLTSTIRNSILLNCSGTFNSGDYNLIANASGCTPLSGGHDLIGVSPNLGSLANNGGPTPTMAPLVGSPAIDGGNPSGCNDLNGNPLLVDQRNESRDQPPAGRCDIGAVEVH